MSEEITFRSDVDVKLARCLAFDVDVVTSARVSTMGDYSLLEEVTPQKVRGLINYLVRERHGSPFEQNSFTFFISAPIFVAREFMRHRIGFSFNEQSGRYTELKPVFYLPGPERKLTQVGKTGDYRFEDGTPEMHAAVAHAARRSFTESWDTYQEMLSEGVAKEVARIVLPVGVYTNFYATCNARSLMHFLSLRTEVSEARYQSHPQHEIQMVAQEMENHFKTVMPITHEAFNTHGRVAP